MWRGFVQCGARRATSEFAGRFDVTLWGTHESLLADITRAWVEETTEMACTTWHRAPQFRHSQRPTHEVARDFTTVGSVTNFLSRNASLFARHAIGTYSPIVGAVLMIPLLAPTAALYSEGDTSTARRIRSRKVTETRRCGHCCSIGSCDETCT